MTDILYQEAGETRESAPSIIDRVLIFTGTVNFVFVSPF